jgi:U3 small nucleolar RNA-associated protein 3
LQAPSFPSREHAIAYLMDQSPELLALVDDFDRGAKSLSRAETEFQTLLSQLGERDPKVGLAAFYYRSLSPTINLFFERPSSDKITFIFILETLLTYLTSVAFYFRLCAAPTDKDALSLKGKVIARVTELREAVSSLEEQGLDGNSDDEDEDDEREFGHLDKEELQELLQDASMGSLVYDSEESEEGSEDEDSEEEEDDEDELIIPPPPPKKRKRGAGEDEGREAKKAVKEKKQAKGAKKSVGGLEPIPFPEDNSTSSSSSRRAMGAEGADEQLDLDFVDPPTLSSADREDKASRRKSLRFYTAKIDAKVAKRAQGGLKGKERLGGDEDVPYRSREQSRRQVLQRQGAAAAKGAEAEADLDAMDWDQDDKDVAAGVMDGEDDGDGYYDLVKRAKAQKKAEKKQAHDKAREEERCVKFSVPFSRPFL